MILWPGRVEHSSGHHTLITILDSFQDEPKPVFGLGFGHLRTNSSVAIDRAKLDAYHLQQVRGTSLERNDKSSPHPATRDAHEMGTPHAREERSTIYEKPSLRAASENDNYEVNAPLQNSTVKSQVSHPGRNFFSCAREIENKSKSLSITCTVPVTWVFHI